MGWVFIPMSSTINLPEKSPGGTEIRKLWIGHPKENSSKIHPIEFPAKSATNVPWISQKSTKNPFKNPSRYPHPFLFHFSDPSRYPWTQNFSPSCGGSMTRTPWLMRSAEIAGVRHFQRGGLRLLRHPGLGAGRRGRGGDRGLAGEMSDGQDGDELSILRGWWNMGDFHHKRWWTPGNLMEFEHQRWWFSLNFWKLNNETGGFDHGKKRNTAQMGFSQEARGFSNQELGNETTMI